MTHAQQAPPGLGGVPGVSSGCLTSADELVLAVRLGGRCRYHSVSQYYTHIYRICNP